MDAKTLKNPSNVLASLIKESKEQENRTNYTVKLHLTCNVKIQPMYQIHIKPHADILSAFM